jgi:hypothetical protein
MAGTAQADRAERHAGGGASRFQHDLWNRPFGVIQAMAPLLKVELN